MTDAPLCIELFAGTFGWSHGWTARGGYVVGFDIEHLPHHGPVPPNASLVLQDVRTLHGSQFRDAALILASSPCPEYSYMAMPWKRAKQIASALHGQGAFPDGYKGSRTVEELNELFLIPQRLQREASEAAGRYIPLIQENVRGAEPWVGKAAWHYGSYYLWGDVPALMPVIERAQKFNPDGTQHGQAASLEGVKAGDRCIDKAAGKWTTGWNVQNVRDMKAAEATKNAGGSWFNVAHNTTSGKGRNPVNTDAGTKGGGDWFSSGAGCSVQRRHGSKSTARKAASALIARIPERLSDWIAEVYWPTDSRGRAITKIVKGDK